MSKDDALVEGWRLGEFERMGFKSPATLQLNAWNVDLHYVQSLISAGCPHHLAMRIVAPDELGAEEESSAGVVERVNEYSA